jgi:hypothetical protein
MEPESPPRGPAPDRPRLQPTRPATLVVAGLAAAAAAWLLVSTAYNEIPPIPWSTAVVLAGLAVLEAYAAVNTRARIERKPGREPVNPLAVARYVVLAKASALVGSIFAGFFAGLVGWLLLERTRAASQDLPPSIASLVAAVGLVLAALWLERSCRVPKQPDDERHADEKPSTP